MPTHTSSKAAKAAAQKRYNRKVLERNRDYLIRLKTLARCKDCNGRFHHSAMQFDHVRGTKSADISRMRQRASMRALKTEIRKCELVCANCHLYRTWERAQPSV